MVHKVKNLLNDLPQTLQVLIISNLRNFTNRSPSPRFCLSAMFLTPQTKMKANISSLSSIINQPLSHLSKTNTSSTTTITLMLHQISSINHRPTNRWKFHNLRSGLTIFKTISILFSKHFYNNLKWILYWQG